MSIYYINRKTRQKEMEAVAGEGLLRWVNDTKPGRTLLELFIKKKLFSTFYGRLQDGTFSARKIAKFIQEYNIDMSEAIREDHNSYKSFNDFFTRELKSESRPFSLDPDVLISPADGRIFAYNNIDINKLIQIKGSYYKLSDLFQDEELAINYSGGTCIVVRLAPTDYHRFHFPDWGIAHKSKKISGDYYSVNPMALKTIVDLYCQNKRELTLFDSENFGMISMVEVGATCVGSIIQTYSPETSVTKGQEKGYFKFGGSTVILFIKKGILNVDSDIISNTNKGFETKVNMGEKIGRKV